MDALLSRQFLGGIGVNLDEKTYQALSEYYESTLNDYIIEGITEELDESQLKDLALLENKSKQELQEWLTMNVPQLSEIIESKVAILLGDIAESADRI